MGGLGLPSARAPRRATPPARVDPPRTVPGLLAARAAIDPDRTAIEVHNGACMTFAEWDRRATAVAAALLARGLRHGDRVALLFGTGDWTDYAVAYCGTVRAGGVAVPCSEHLAAAQVRGVLDHSAAGTLIVGARRTALKTASSLDPTDAAVTITSLAELERDGLARGPDPVGATVRPGDQAQILYTSGTTGQPKGVAATHANLTFGAATHPRRRRLAHSERFVHAFPVGTNAGQTMLLNALDAKPAALTMATFTPSRFARLVEESGAGSVFVVPAMAIELLRSGELARRDLSKVLLFGSTAAALPPAVASELTGVLPNALVVNYYTSTEAAPAQTSMMFDPGRPAAVGRAADGELMIGDEDATPLPPGEVGEVWLRSPFPRRYHRDEDASRAVFRDGWVRMGDLGRLDADGYLYLVDRDRDVIKSGANKVSTIQVESELFEHPAVAQAAVFGAPHPVLGAEVVAAVVARAAVTAADLRAFLLGRLATHEVPTRIVFVDGLPRNAGGKVLKRELVERFRRQPN